jgi:hypothetical protein
MGNDWVFWAMVGAFILHSLEELFTAGGFLANYNEYLIGIGRAPKSYTWLYAVLAFWALPGVVVAALIGSKFLIFSLGVMFAFFFNAIAHIILFIVQRKFSSGMLSGVLIIIPLTIYSYYIFMNTGQLSIADAFWSMIVGAAFNIPTLPYKKLR